MNHLIFALLDNSAQFPEVALANRARELSIAYCRFKYSGPIIEGSDPDLLLGQAADSGEKYCVLLPYGCFLAEVWVDDREKRVGIMNALEQFADSAGKLAAGVFSHAPAESTRPLMLFVDLEQYRHKGRPAFEPILELARKNQLPAEVVQNLVHPDWYTTPEHQRPEPMSGYRFEAFTRELTRNLERAVFVWNIESYRDIETPAPSNTAPLKALYTVAAGFKPNRILHTHGATQDTRVLVFDYSEKGLEYRRLLHQEWDGVDFPVFLRKVLRTLPPSDAHYLLWQGADAKNLDWTLMEARWQQEVDAWGGAQVLRDHWQIYQGMDVEYLHCDLLKEPELLLERIHDQAGSLIWWSNAFLTIHSISHYSAAERRAIYSNWIKWLAETAPELHVYGADCNNLSVNGFTVREYADWLGKAEHDPLDILQPQGLSRIKMHY